jgi:hypothetical protein
MHVSQCQKLEAIPAASKGVPSFLSFSPPPYVCLLPPISLFLFFRLECLLLLLLLRERKLKFVLSPAGYERSCLPACLTHSLTSHQSQLAGVNVRRLRGERRELFTLEAATSDADRATGFPYK